MSKSLRNEVNVFAEHTFPEIYNRPRLDLIIRFIEFINSPKRGLIVLPITVGVFFIGQIFNPKFLQWLNIPIDTSRIIIDQRVSNLATIFSITLVVIGWLLTNLSVKESLSFQLLFKRTYLYPIFYFVGTLISCLIIFSLLRHEVFINLGNIVIAGTLLIIIALTLITMLFVKFIKVVDSAFIYNALAEEVIKEASILARMEIMTRRSRTVYNETCEQLGLEDGIGFNKDLSGHTGINITKKEKNNKVNELDWETAFDSVTKFEVYDVDLEKLEKEIKQLGKLTNCYFRPLQVGSNIGENFFPFYIHSRIILPEKIDQKVRKAFRLKTQQEKIVADNRHLNYFNERFMKDVKDGKSDNIEKGLALYSRLFDLEDKIYSKC